MNVHKKSLGARSGFAICVCQTKCWVLWWEINVCCWQKVTLPPPWPPPSTFLKSRHLIHVSKLVLIEITLVLLTLGSHPYQRKGFLVYSYIHLQIPHGIWNEYCSLSWSDLVAHLKGFVDLKNVSGYSSVTLIGMFVYDSNLYSGILRITMDFTFGLGWSVTKAVEQSMVGYWHITVDTASCCALICLWGSLYMNRTGCTCIGSLFMRKYIWIPWWPVLIV